MMWRCNVFIAVFSIALAASVGTATADRDSIGGLLIQPDGKIVAAGLTGGSFSGLTGEIGVARYTSSGQLDPSFAEDGLATVNFANGSEARAVARQTDGKLVVVGGCCGAELGEPGGFAIARLNADGSLDTSFSEDGEVAVSLGTFAEATSVVIEPSGAILVAGVGAGGTSGLIVRLTSSGALDTTFSEDGSTSVSTGRIWGMARQSDGKIIVVGESNTEHFFVARLNADGSPDGTWDTDGVTEAGPAGHADAEAVAIQSDGKIVAVGSAGDAYTNDYAVARYNSSDGSLDMSFSGDGIATQSVGNFDVADSVAIQPNGSVLVGGEEFGSFAVTRFLGAGALDSGFGTAGVLLDHPEADGRAIALDGDGSFIVGGATNCCEEDSQFLLSRYDSSGAKVAAFGTSGDVITDFDGSSTVSQPGGGSPPPVVTPPPASTPVAVSRPTPTRRKCRKGFVRKHTGGHTRCVKKHHKKRHKRR